MKKCKECFSGPKPERGAATRQREADYREKHRVAIRAQSNAFFRRVREEVLAHYGGKCACCGEDKYEFLAIDHINGGGSKHRAEVKYRMDYWLWKNHFPEGFRILCHNCNMALGRYGYCPHRPLALDAAAPTTLPLSAASQGEPPC